MSSTENQEIAQPVSAELAATNNGRRNKPLCRSYILHQSCYYGDNCRYSHEFPSSPPIDNDIQTDNEELKTKPTKLIPCHFFQMGTCRYGEFCRYGHFFPEEEESNDHKNNEDGITSSSCAAKSNDVAVCGVCLEEINPRSSAGNRKKKKMKFGLLTGCDHCFCYDCLMEWRRTKLPPSNPDEAFFGSRSDDNNTTDNRSKCCPTCRVKSDYIVPSDVLLTGEDKEKFIRQWRSEKSKTPCNWFNGSFGSCRFGKECLYAHLDRSGRDVKLSDKDPSQLLRDRRSRRRRRRPHHNDFFYDDGEYEFIRLMSRLPFMPFRMSQIFETERLSRRSASANNDRNHISSDRSTARGNDADEDYYSLSAADMQELFSMIFQPWSDDENDNDSDVDEEEMINVD